MEQSAIVKIQEPAGHELYTESLAITLRGKPITLHPLPHPSPLNARWYRKVPDLLRTRLDALGCP